MKNNARTVLYFLNDALVRAPRADREFAQAIISLIENTHSVLKSPINDNEYLVDGVIIRVKHKTDQYSKQNVPTEIEVQTPGATEVSTGTIRKPFLMGRIMFAIKEKMDTLKKQEVIKTSVLNKILTTVQYQK